VAGRYSCVFCIGAFRVEQQSSKYWRCQSNQHPEEREWHANGYKPKTVHTRVGSFTFAIPQVREGGFYLEALEKGQRSERTLLLGLAAVAISA